MSKHRRSGNVQLPWSREGWSTDEYRAGRDPKLDKLVEEQGRGLNPYGYYEDRPGLASSPLMHNPYFAFPLAPVFVWVAVFLWGKFQQDLLWLAWVMAIFIGLVTVIVVGMAILRIPGWHRARKVARLYVAEHGGKFPLELRWYT